MREKRLYKVCLLLLAAVVAASYIPVSAVVNIELYEQQLVLLEKRRQQQVPVSQQPKPKTWKQFFSETIYTDTPVLQKLHDDICKVVGIKDLNSSLAQLPKKSSRFGWLMRPWISLARKYMTKGFFARMAGVGAVNYFFTPKSWSNWFGLRGIDLIIGGPIVSVSSLIYKWLLNKVLPESIKINKNICFTLNLYGKDWFGQMGGRLKDYLVDQAQAS